MSKKPSVAKRIRQAEDARQRNKHYKSMVKTTVKKVQGATTRSEAEGLLREAVAVIDSVAGKGVIHKNNAAHKKSRLSDLVAKKPQ